MAPQPDSIAEHHSLPTVKFMAMCFREALFIAASVGVVLCTMPIKVFEDGCPDVVRSYYGLPIPFKVCGQGLAWCQWRWTCWIDVVIVYFTVAVVLRVRRHLRNA